MVEKLFYFLVFGLLSFSILSAQTTQTGNSRFELHKKVAILPFKIEFISKLPKTKKFSSEEINELKKYMSLALQQHLYDFFKNQQQHTPYSVNFQSTELTNQILSTEKIKFADVFNGDKSGLCKILGVDAVIFAGELIGKKSYKNSTVDDFNSEGEIQLFVNIFDSTINLPIWSYQDLDKKIRTINPFLAPKYPEGVRGGRSELHYQSDNKYQKAFIPWIGLNDLLFNEFLKKIPYKSISR